MGPFFTEFADECVTAAEVYSCGKQKEPTIVNTIFTESKGNNTIVRYSYIDIHSRGEIVLIFILTSTLLRPLASQIHVFANTKEKALALST
jgi:hypothetical protein